MVYIIYRSHSHHFPPPFISVCFPPLNCHSLASPNKIFTKGTGAQGTVQNKWFTKPKRLNKIKQNTRAQGTEGQKHHGMPELKTEQKTQLVTELVTCNPLLVTPLLQTVVVCCID